MTARADQPPTMVATRCSGCPCDGRARMDRRRVLSVTIARGPDRPGARWSPVATNGGQGALPRRPLQPAGGDLACEQLLGILRRPPDRRVPDVDLGPGTWCRRRIVTENSVQGRRPPGRGPVPGSGLPGSRRRRRQRVADRRGRAPHVRNRPGELQSPTSDWRHDRALEQRVRQNGPQWAPDHLREAVNVVRLS